MSDLDSLNTFLQNQDYFEQSNSNYFTRLYDNWLYANGSVREAGYRFSVGFDTYLDTYNSFYHRANDVTSYVATINYHHEKPISLFWQSSLNLKLAMGEVKSYWHSMNSLEKEARGIVTVGAAKYKIGWYPNSRTTSGWTTALNYINYKKKAGSNYHTDANGHIMVGTSELMIDYYLSPKIRLNAGVTFTYTDNENIKYYHRPFMEDTPIYEEGSTFLSYRFSMTYHVF